MNSNLHLLPLRALLFAHFREAVPLACAALLPRFREAVPLARALFIADSLAAVAAAACCRFVAFFLGCVRAFAVCFAALAAACCAASGAFCWQERDPERPARATIASKSHQQASKPERMSSHADERPARMSSHADEQPRG